MQSNGKGAIILVLGILSIFFCYFLGPVAWIMGNSAMAETTDSNERNLINIGRILGIVGTVFLILSILAVVLFVVAFGGIAAIVAILSANPPALPPPAW